MEEALRLFKTLVKEIVKRVSLFLCSHALFDISKLTWEVQFNKQEGYYKI
jgi:hypothetical protein